MASNPSSQMEDQTDEDFFDKLIDETFDITQSDGEPKDSARAEEDSRVLDSLVTGNVIAGVDPDGECCSQDAVWLPLLAPKTVEIDISIPEDQGASESMSGSTMDATAKSGDAESDNPDAAFKPSETTSGGPKGISIKEVQWSAFSANSGWGEVGNLGSDFFNELEGNSPDAFAGIGHEPKAADSKFTTDPVGNQVEGSALSSNLPEHQQEQSYGAVGVQNQDVQDFYSVQYWESLYPGWKFDPNSGQWYQIDGHNVAGTTQMDSQDKGLSENRETSNMRSEVSYLQQNSQSDVGTVVQNCTTGSISNWNNGSQGSFEYPSNMIFDSQYPGWYYDTIAQEWRSLESYNRNQSVMMNAGNKHSIQDESDTLGSFLEKERSFYGEYQFEKSEDLPKAESNSVQPSMWQSKLDANSGRTTGYFAESQQSGSLHHPAELVDKSAEPQIDFKTTETSPLSGRSSHCYDGPSAETRFHSLSSTENLYQYNPQNGEQNQQMHALPNYFGESASTNYTQQSFQNGHATIMQTPYAQHETGSSAGRPRHALVTFGFGGKLVVLKDNTSLYGSQGSIGGSISIMNLMEVVDKDHAASTHNGACDYFGALCQQSFPGPLVGGNAAIKDINKWVDEGIANCQSPFTDFRTGELLRLLLSLLKICCQNYGKLRSPFGVDSTSQEFDGPELAVTKLFASARRNGAESSSYGGVAHCMQNLLTEEQIQRTAVEVQSLLVSGRRKEALQRAQEGQLWGPALVLAAQLGEKFYVDTVRQMARRQFVSGSPLRTLCLLISGQPADVFSGDNSSPSASSFSHMNLPQQAAQFLANGMLDDWEENLAIITANRTKDDELVIIHLGDCLWKERGQVAAAHTCYLVSEANLESYSDSARLCLIGADHWKCPRTYASPEAIQRTELYEYSKVLGNSQFILLPFQPYKIIYAHMLAEVGKVSDSLRYCQAILKTLKNSGRTPEVEAWKSLLISLEERIKTHQQGGYSTNLAPAKLVGKLFNSIDRSIHRMIGTPPPLPLALESSAPSGEQDNSLKAPKVASSQSTMAMSSLVLSASMEPISEWATDSDRRALPNRSISEPDFSRSPKQDQVSPSKKVSQADGKSSMAGGPSRFGRFGSQLLQKTMGWVSRSRPDRQAKLGEKNKFYYDEKLKRWVEEGAEPPAEAAALLPPPTAASFQNGASDTSGGVKSQNLSSFAPPETRTPSCTEHSPGLPPIPPSTNQFSARGRMGVRSRYVDTFNKGGGTTTNLFQSPSTAAAKTAAVPNFFVPSAVPSVDQTVDTIGERSQDLATSEEHSTSTANDTSFSSVSPSAPSLQRYPSMNNINIAANQDLGDSRNGISAPSHSRAASWSGSCSGVYNTKPSEVKPLGDTVGTQQPSPFMPNNTQATHAENSGCNDLHEVEL